MGIYNVVCPTCAKTHTWFSGLTDQRCPECRNKEVPMSNEQELISALKSALNAKDDLITHLKAEIERLKASQISQVIQPVINPLNPQIIVGPGTLPYIQTPNPLNPPWIVTSGSTAEIRDISGAVRNDPGTTIDFSKLSTTDCTSVYVGPEAGLSTF